MQILDFARLNLHFDIDLLRKDLAALMELKWESHYNKKDFEGNWTLIALRSPTGSPQNILAFSPAAGFQDSPALDVCPYFQEVISTFECEKKSIRLMNLKVGGQIKPHTDTGLSYASGILRIHIPIFTSPKVDFVINDTRLEMKPGECWYGNFEQPHWVANHSKEDRIHLVMDCIRNEWTDSLFMSHAYSLEQLLYKPAETIAIKDEDLPAVIAALRRMNTETARKLVAEFEGKQKQ